MEYTFDDIESCECIGTFDDEYVYDIEVGDNTHTFIGNDILVHNSLYLCYEPLLETIEGIENMSIEQKRDIVVKLNTEFMDQHNRDFINDYYSQRFGKSVHEFELEILMLSGIWLDVKKRYAGIELWKDGKVFDLDKLPMKIKGLEMVKAQYPRLSRAILKDVVQFILENAEDKYLVQRTNIKVQEWLKKWMEADIEDICENKGVNGYTKYILSDEGNELRVAPKCPSNVRACGNYNLLRKLHNLPGDPIYGGKVKIYQFKKGGDWDYFAFQSTDYPEWADQYAPIDRRRMFQQFVLDPLNRIAEANRMPELTLDGYIQCSLF